jgi:lysophospholipase L1-like esterase
MKIFNTEKTIRFILLAVIIVALGCIVATVVLVACGVKGELFHTPEIHESKPQKSNSTALGDTPDYGENYLKNIVFVGDATISNMRNYSTFSDLEIWTGESGDLSLDYSIDTATVVFKSESISIANAAKQKRSDYMIITVGIKNGVSYCTEEKFKSYYGKLIESVIESAPDTKIILQSVFPISAEKEKDTPSLSNKKINEANIWISELAKKYNVRYLDTASVLKDSSGKLSEEYDSGDGLILNEAGYHKVIEYIRTHGYR